MQNDSDQFKHALSGYGSDEFCHVNLSCCIVIRKQAAQFPDFAMLAKIALVIPMTNVPAERGFSIQNTIKTDGQNQLREEHVTRLMMLNIHGKGATDFDAGAASNHFFGHENTQEIAVSKPLLSFIYNLDICLINDLSLQVFIYPLDLSSSGFTKICFTGTGFELSCWVKTWDKS